MIILQERKLLKLKKEDYNNMNKLNTISFVEKLVVVST